MSLIPCDNKYEQDLSVFTEQVLQRYGTSSEAAQREVMYLSDSCNVVAIKYCADLIFYGRILRTNPYRDSFDIYLKAAGIETDEEGNWSYSGVAYPLAFWDLAYFLLNYKRGSFLHNAEDIPKIDVIPEMERHVRALELATTCLQYSKVPGAVNLVGRILKEASESEDTYEILKDVISSNVSNRDFELIGLSVPDCSSSDICSEVADTFFKCAANQGYVYACNNLATKEAERIIELKEAGAPEKEISDAIGVYTDYLKLSADKYEPYAANRLGLFYRTGEIKCAGGREVFREYTDSALAKEYFLRATVYPDANSAWAFLNLIKYYYSDYEKDIDLMNEHMEYIKKLNPEVYDIAIEL